MTAVLAIVLTWAGTIAVLNFAVWVARRISGGS